MKKEKHSQESRSIRHYRLFLCVVLVVVLVFAGGVYYNVCKRAEILEEGTLVHSAVSDERKA